MISRRGVLAGGAAAGIVALAPGAAARAAAGTAGHGGATGSVVAVGPDDSAAEILAKAARVVPRAPQVAWQERQVTGFTHFGMNTFTDREWGSGCEDEALFDPPAAEVEQWMRAYRAAGMKQVMLTAKHHDGFVVYPTRYTAHSVLASPWWYRGGRPDAAARAARVRAGRERGTDPAAYWRVRHTGNVNPRGDLLGTYLQAARRAGLTVGVYLSPADGAELPHAWHRTWVEEVTARHDAGAELSVEEQSTYDDRDRSPAGHGRYGSGSARVERTVPTLVPGDDRAAAVRSGRLPSFRVVADDYNAYYLNQLYELFTQYGPIDELWLDGANPWSSSGITETYDFTAWFRLIEALSPDTVTFAGPQGTRWVGNEEGRARAAEWSVTPATADPATAHGETLLPGGPQAADIGSDAALTAPGVRYLQWFPAEADVSLRPGWFWHPAEQPKTAEELLGLYETSVGRNAVLLLNVPPDTSGRVAPEDVASLTGFGRAVAGVYGRNLLAGGGPSGTVRALTDGRLGSGWSPAAGARTGVVEVRLRPGTRFDRVRLGEDITRGQHVEAFAVEARAGGVWRQVASGTTIGYARILATSAPVTADAVRVRITAARGAPRLAALGLHRAVR
ncbi:alpha-L-fucosidase [Streptomyces sp. NPDC047002]|uniref:alpha-L-fucosidase n=1 Tax=Streptomyces sp. NPDC047002 TaxID=3155475 RepID=UPI0034528ABC